MELWLENTLTSETTSLLGIVAAFGLGLLGAISSCCTLPVIGAITGYSCASSQTAGRFELIRTGLGFLIGSCLALFAMGAIIGYLSQNLAASVGLYWKVTSGVLIILLGLFTLELVPFRLPRLPFATRSSVSKPGLFGLALGGASTACGACCNPMVGIVFGLVLLNGGTIWGAGLMGSFALGYSLPMTAGVVGIHFGLSRLSARLASWAQPIRRISGLLLLIAGFYLILEV